MRDRMTTARRLLTRLLLSFALISVGYAMGKHAAAPSGDLAGAEDAAARSATHQGETVRVYYLHATFRCVTCNTIEEMTKALLESEFAREIAAGAVRMESVDFQENEAIARRYEVVSSCVVVAHVRDGEEVAYRRLDEVWTLLKDPPAFNRYVGDVIRGFLAEGESAS